MWNSREQEDGFCIRKCGIAFNVTVIVCEPIKNRQMTSEPDSRVFPLIDNATTINVYGKNIGQVTQFYRLIIDVFLVSYFLTILLFYNIVTLAKEILAC